MSRARFSRLSMESGNSTSPGTRSPRIWEKVNRRRWAALPQPARAPGETLTAAAYEMQRAQCVTRWQEVLAQGMTLDLPEPIVNHAWRAALIGSFVLLTEDEIRYSHGNQYAKLYVGEGGDAVRAFILYGHRAAAARMIPPLFVYTRKNLEFHQAAFKLQLLAHYFRLTRERAFLEEHRELWEKEM